EFLIGELQADAQSAYDKREKDLGEEVARELERRVVLSVLDRKWREHLYEMDYLQEGIGLRSFGQRDPLVEYQREAFTMFQVMLEGIKEESVGFLFNLEVEVNAFDPEAAGEAGVDAEQPAVIEGALADTDEASADEEPADEAVLPRTAGSRRPIRTVADVLPKELSSARRPTNLSYSAPPMDADGG